MPMPTERPINYETFRLLQLVQYIFREEEEEEEEEEKTRCQIRSGVGASALLL